MEHSALTQHLTPEVLLIFHLLANVSGISIENNLANY